jgi:hypothetical protein
VFEIRLRILAYGPNRFLGIAEGFPDILTFSSTSEEAEIDLANAVIDHLRRSMNSDRTRLDWDDRPVVRTIRLRLRICLYRWL